MKKYSVDEMNEITKKAHDAVFPKVNGLVSGKVVITSIPHSKNHFYEMYLEQMKVENTYDMKLIPLLESTTPYKDEFDKDIVFDEGGYKISVNSLTDCELVILWFQGNIVGQLELTNGRTALTKGYKTVRGVYVEKKHQRKGLAREMYKMALEYSNNLTKGIGGEYEQMSNKNIPKIYKSLGGHQLVSGDWVIDRK